MSRSCPAPVDFAVQTVRASRALHAGIRPWGSTADRVRTGIRGMERPGDVVGYSYRGQLMRSRDWPGLAPARTDRASGAYAARR